MNSLEIALNTIENLANENMKEIGEKILIALAECNTKEEMEKGKEIVKAKLKINDKQFSYLLMCGLV